MAAGPENLPGENWMTIQNNKVLGISGNIKFTLEYKGFKNPVFFPNLMPPSKGFLISRLFSPFQVGFPRQPFTGAASHSQ